MLLHPPIADNRIVVVLTVKFVRQTARETAMVIAMVPVRAIVSLVPVARELADAAQASRDKAKAVIAAAAATRLAVDHAPGEDNNKIIVLNN
jgi:hypothetical protein